MDETADLSRREQASICVRYVTPDLEVFEDFLGLYELPDTKAATLHKVVCDVVTRCQLDMDKLRAQCYDGAANMSGAFSGLQALIKADQPKALFVHCAAHRMNLVVQDSFAEVSELRDGLHELGRMVEYLRDSPKRLAAFSAKDGATALRPLCPTRWTCRDACVRSVLNNYVTIMEFLIELASDRESRPEARSTASGFARSMSCFRFYFAASLALKLLDLVTPVTRAVQGPKLSLQQTLSMVGTLETTLEAQRDNFDRFWCQVTDAATEAGVEEPVLPRATRPPKRLDEGSTPHRHQTAKDLYRQVFYQGVDAVRTSLNERFKISTDAATLANAERCLVAPEDGEFINDTATFFDLNPARLRTHVETLQDYAHTRGIELSCLQDVRELLISDVSARTIMTEVVQLVKMLLTAPATSCSAERSFSLLRRIKTWLRTTMSQRRLNATAVCAAYPDEVESADVAQLARVFISQKPVRGQRFMV
ncbi:zinc finger MYM-type protein 1-like [Amphibalanus amphitrite]|uniref:zinc finger MYM-type protein 1-like n=1 Tax=Amphibalanus amphitrite TaxID=1232801 RepID=UPI001C8FBB09|nr:zinc finger MYM-type protein 1-like [Amphibalanus amphitrite]XP_043220537.1 zinc finger MYM-type protein 1-like [Amphibalanus amphitrite]